MAKARMSLAHQLPNAPVKEGDVLAAKYRIEQVIGVGGMGVVVSAMHLELDQRVALKFLLPQAATNDELVGRFVREAKASVKLKGKHVAQVLDVGRMDDGRAYIVMEYLEGRDLGAELKASRDQFSIEEAVSWMLQACEGLAEAHALGIVHRDLKPGNLFLTRGTDGRPLVKVLDFGISKSINPNSSDMLSLTKTEMLLGSPLYMAPEQMRSSKYVDERSDIWALGAIAYELLTRRVPFEADTLLDLCFKVAQEGCPAVSEVRPEVPEELSAVVMKCLEKDAEARWTDIGELAAALEPFAPEFDRGSADRTRAVLATGIERAKARAERELQRQSNPDGQTKLSDSGASGTRASSPDAKKISSSSKNGSGKTPQHITKEHLITGTATTERAPSTPPAATAVSDVAPDDASAPDAVPASSAWGTTNAAEIERKKSRRSLVVVGVAAIATAVLAFVIARGGGGANTNTTTTSPTSTPTVTTTQPPPQPVDPTPAATNTNTQPAPVDSSPSAPPSHAAAPSTRSAPATVGAALRPKPSATPSAVSSAPAAPPPKPVDSSGGGGFIHVRE